MLLYDSLFSSHRDYNNAIFYTYLRHNFEKYLYLINLILFLKQYFFIIFNPSQMYLFQNIFQMGSCQLFQDRTIVKNFYHTSPFNETNMSSQANYQNHQKQNKKGFIQIKQNPNVQNQKNYKIKQEQIQTIFQKGKTEFDTNWKSMMEEKQINSLPQNDLMEGMTYDEVKGKQEKLKEIIRQYQKIIQRSQQFGKKIHDPEKYRQFKDQARQNYVQKIKQMHFQQKNVSQGGKSIKFIVGRISSGKSSLINSFFDKRQEVGLGETTLKASLVYSNHQVDIYDTPGECQNFNTQHLDIVKHIASSNEIYILFSDSLKTIENMVKVIAAIKPHCTIILRTQCDRANKSSFRSIQQQIEQDYAILRKWNLSDLKIYATSAFIKDGFQNNIVKEMMRHKCKRSQLLDK